MGPVPVEPPVPVLVLVPYEVLVPVNVLVAFVLVSAYPGFGIDLFQYGDSITGFVQQICCGQSLLTLQLLGQFLWQIPPQHNSSVPVHSLDCVHGFGHEYIFEFVQYPPLLSAESICARVVQHTSPACRLHPDADEHACGHQSSFHSHN